MTTTLMMTRRELYSYLAVGAIACMLVGAILSAALLYAVILPYRSAQIQTALKKGL